MQKTARNFLLFIVIALLLAGNIYFYVDEKDKQAPDINFTFLDGKVLNLNSMLGKPLLLNFWATTCSPCRKEIPELAKLHEEFQPQGVRFIGIAMSHDRPDQVIKFMQQYQIPYSLSLDIDNAIANAYGVQAIPVTILISPRGQIEFQHSGVIEVNELRKRIAAMLPEHRR